MREEQPGKKKSWSMPQIDEIKLKMTESGGGGCTFGDGGGGAGFAGGGSIVSANGFVGLSGLISVS